jgi:hypothetical protein
MNFFSWHQCLMGSKHVLAAAAIAAVASGMIAKPTFLVRAESFTPDHDGNGYNNSFERAIDIGSLTSTGVNIKEQLGVVPWGFDTTDFYKFVFPGGLNDMYLSVKLDEDPDTSMWINLYDAKKNVICPICPSIGSANETFSLPLAQGVYYIEILTDKRTANGRNLKYTISAKAVERPLPEKGGSACRGAPDLGALTNQSRTIEGNLNEVKRASFYSFHVPYGTALSGNMLGEQPSQRYVLTVIDRLNSRRIPFRNSTLKDVGVMLDPGFYCLEIASVGFSGLGNYRGQFAALQAGLRPGGTKQLAQNIVDMELGNLSENGRYSTVSRYLHYQKPGEQPNVPTIIEHNHYYVIRDWVGSSSRNQYYWFNLPERSRVEVRLVNQMASTRVFLEDQEGNVLASTIVDSSSLNPDLLPSQSLTTMLPSGKRYFLRINYLSNSAPGTSFGVLLRALPPSS